MSNAICEIGSGGEEEAENIWVNEKISACLTENIYGKCAMYVFSDIYLRESKEDSFNKILRLFWFFVYNNLFTITIVLTLVVDFDCRAHFKNVQLLL